MMADLKGFILVITTIYFLTTSSSQGSILDFTENNNAFSMNLYNELLKDPNNKGKSLVFSPFSIQTAGGLLYAGAKGQTGDEILAGFKLPGTDVNSVSEAFSNYFKTNANLLTSGQLNMANKLYIMNGYSLNPTYMDIAVKNYNSEIQNINFGDSAGAAKTINDWVEAHTNGKIQNLVQPDSINDLMRLYLVNAVQFKSEWENKFKAELTTERDFFVTLRNIIQIPTMLVTAELGYASYGDLKATGIEMKFKNSDLSFFVLIPMTLDTPLEKLEDSLKNYNLKDLFSKVGQQEVSVAMPKFKIELLTDLKQVLRNLNMNSMFEMGKADFTNLLTAYEDLAVSEAVHKAFIDINEEGGEAGASTGFGITSRMGPLMVSLNYPFMYFIKSSAGDIYFMGRFTGE